MFSFSQVSCFLSATLRKNNSTSPGANQHRFCTAPSIPLFIKVSWQIFTLIMHLMLRNTGSIRGAERDPHAPRQAAVVCHLPLLRYETLKQREEGFHCDVHTHPSSQSHSYERVFMHYQMPFGFPEVVWKSILPSSDGLRFNL